MRKLQPTLVIVLALVGSARICEAGSPVPDPLLAQVHEIRLGSGWDLHFDPVPGLDLDRLEREIRERSAAAVELAGLSRNQEADAVLWVNIDHAWEGDDRETLALLVEVTVRIPAEPAGDLGLLGGSRRRSLAIWGSQRLTIARGKEAERTICDLLGRALERFVEDRLKARAP